LEVPDHLEEVNRELREDLVRARLSLLRMLFGPAPAALDMNLHRNSIGMSVVQSWINDLAHLSDHDLLHEPRHLLGLILRALHYQLVVAGTAPLWWGRARWGRSRLGSPQTRSYYSSLTYLSIGDVSPWYLSERQAQPLFLPYQL